MAKQKRTQSIDLNAMRKRFALKPLAVGVASLLTYGCGSDDRQDAQIYTSVEDCTIDNPDAVEQCTAAYQTALDEAAKTAPRYESQFDCENEYGTHQCRQYDNGGGSFFMPFMAGYMVSQLLSPNRYYSQPLFTSYSPYSPYRNRWMMSDGYVFDGDIRRRNYKVKSSVYRPKPVVSKPIPKGSSTIKRGGFGSSVRAKSSWGSSKSKGWGG